MTVETRLMGAVELSEVMAVSVRTIRRMASERRLPGQIRFGRAIRWDRAKIMDWVQAGCPAREGGAQ
ncbi:MAG: helix-turn-helix transcriptional regulator [Pirellulales bacterium]